MTLRICISGPPKSGKSSLAYEMVLWLREMGVSSHITDDDVPRGVLNLKPTARRALIKKACSRTGEVSISTEHHK